ncbi:hypothetical protein [Rothia terrae]|uniref:Uncharacterized protein n=1 Tax=Rothia terrae TaxID=396015 RepID=A0A7H2BGF4_9MICC|nr:hypothetical protein [Rothia terrae]QNV38750.1 hypothetical protein IDM49_05785 [Rothia terrae]
MWEAVPGAESATQATEIIQAWNVLGKGKPATPQNVAEALNKAFDEIGQALKPVMLGLAEIAEALHGIFAPLKDITRDDFGLAL